VAAMDYLVFKLKAEQVKERKKERKIDINANRKINFSKVLRKNTINKKNNVINEKR
jgi:hypothetical protein